MIKAQNWWDRNLEININKLLYNTMVIKSKISMVICKKSLVVICSLYTDMSLMTTGLLQVVWIIDDGVMFVVSARILPSLSVFRDEKGVYKGVQYILTFFFLLLLV